MNVSYLIDRTQSPIEARLLLAIVEQCERRGRLAVVVETMDFYDLAARAEASMGFEREAVFVAPQMQIGAYRVDIGLYALGHDEKPVFVAVECDGREFHSTDAQRERDARRDVFISRATGGVVQRFPGRQIYRHERSAAALALLRISSAQKWTFVHPEDNTEDFGEWWDLSEREQERQIERMTGEHNDHA